jgi:AAA+ ATPase superfamily predicted ATPase
MRQGQIGRPTLQRRLHAHLDAVAASGTGRILAIRGRRQVGKSTAIEAFVNTCEVPHIVTTGVFAISSHQQIERANEAFAETSRPLPGQEIFAGSIPTTWREWFSRLAAAAGRGPIVAVIDEFPWCTAADPTLDGELQVIWDRVLERLPILLILVGSDVAMMERYGEHDRPLFGRLTPLVISALGPAEVAEALTGVTAFDAIDAYLITGGYPRLVTDLIRAGTGARTWAKHAVLDPFNPLVTTAQLTLDSEFPDPTAAYQVLSAIGAHDVATPSFGDLLADIQGPSSRKTTETALTRALAILAGPKALILRDTPAWAQPTGRLRRYRLTDPYLRFWFRYVARRVEDISRGRGDLAAADIERDWTSWRGRAVEPLVRDAVMLLGKDDPRLVGVENAHAWWTAKADIEVDIVATNAERSLVVGSIKWRAERGFDDRDLAKLAAARRLVPRAQQAALAAVIPSGQAPAGIDIVLTADDIISAWRPPVAPVPAMLDADGVHATAPPAVPAPPRPQDVNLKEVIARLA